jgi:MYXO-CTERM domain-containing protein
MAARLGLAVALCYTIPAHADGVRYDLCMAEGDHCNNAIPGSDPTVPEPGGSGSPDTAKAAGLCQSAKCSRPEPMVGGGVIVYDCLRCIATDEPSAKDDEGGCECRGAGAASPRSLAGGMLLLGFGALLWSRRRR